MSFATVKRVRCERDSRTVDALVRRDGPLQSLELLGRAYGPIGGQPQLAPEDVAKMKCFEGTPIFHDVSPSERGPVVGVVTRAYADAAPGELWIRASLRPVAATSSLRSDIEAGRIGFAPIFAAHDDAGVLARYDAGIGGLLPFGEGTRFRRCVRVELSRVAFATNCVALSKIPLP